ncbi:MAG TPA: ribosome assembly cofactor RimP [Bacteroidaceae bacterium]|nr:ribosome assembly cofactor RimP [Bacteroidaceae bacterium]
MIDRQLVVGLTQEWLADKESYFLVDVNISSDNCIVVEIDHIDGVWVDDCVDLNRFLESRLDRDVEDYELEVGSSGIGQPFKVNQQYINHIGREVEVKPKNGAKISGVLKCVDSETFTITTRQKVTAKGAKRPKQIDVDVDMRYDEIDYTKCVISFK